MRKPKQLFSLFPYFRHREKERERVSWDRRGRFNKRASSRSRWRRLAISDSSVYLPEWWKSRVETIKALQHLVATEFERRFRSFSMASWPYYREIVSDDAARSSLCSITFLQCYCLGTGRYGELHQLERVFRSRLTFRTAEVKTKRSANNLKKSTYSRTRVPLYGRIWYGFLRWKLKRFSHAAK